ncbi:hypothetical protein T190115A13A_60055 [Tenacibaculum sp. 190524A02b]|uniref:Uncharacterized protein n=1 Tax=Tenacibaculum vairaonense TaxID=3137860 RepID=A0ABP1FCH8_9FLAO
MYIYNSLINPINFKMGEFVIKKNSTRELSFNLKANSGKIIGKSEMYF